MRRGGVVYRSRFRGSLTASQKFNAEGIGALAYRSASAHLAEALARLGRGRILVQE